MFLNQGTEVLKFSTTGDRVATTPPEFEYDIDMNKISFPNRTGFHQKLNQRVNQYFEQRNLAKTGDWRMFLKSGIILAWFAISYLCLVFLADSLITAGVSAFALALGFVLVGFNIMHDGAHDSYSSNKRVNRVMAWTLDLLGGSQMLWRQKHNILHHTYTNIEGVDDDLDTSGLLRLSPEQARRPWHRFQHLYAFVLYSLLTINGFVFSDFKKFFSGRIGAYRLQKPTSWQTFSFFTAKGLYFGYTVAIPLFFHPPLVVLPFFIFVHLISGLIFSLVFQLAHAVEGTSFPKPDPETGIMEAEWSIHEVETTANFATDNRFVTWFCGALNFQIEHHLFSRICHIHYPNLSRIVRETCEEFQIRYTCYPTVRSAIVMHYRFLKKLGKPAGHGPPAIAT